MPKPKVFTALATSVDGYITGPDPSPEQPLGTGGGQLFDWHGSGNVPSRQFTDFRLFPASAEVFDDLAARAGAVTAGRTTYDHSHGFGGGGPHPTAPLFVLTHRRPDDASPNHTFVRTSPTSPTPSSGELGGPDTCGGQPT